MTEKLDILEINGNEKKWREHQTSKLFTVETKDRSKKQALKFWKQDHGKSQMSCCSAQKYYHLWKQASNTKRADERRTK